MLKGNGMTQNCTLGDVFRIIREDVLGLSLLEAGALIDISGTTYNRFEKNNFGKSFSKKRNATLRYWSEMIARAVFEEIERKNIKLNQRMKDVLIKLYSNSIVCEEDTLYYLERFNHEECNSLEDFIYNIFLIFSGETEVNVPENLIIKNHIKNQDIYRIKNNVSGKIINYTELKNCVVKLVELLGPKDIMEVAFGSGLTATMISQAITDIKIKVIDIKKLEKDENLDSVIDPEIHKYIDFIRADINYIHGLKTLPELILFVNSFHHIGDPLDNKILLLQKLFQQLSSGSRVCIADPFLPEFYGFVDEIAETRRMWDNRIMDTYCNTFWSSLDGYKKDNVIYSRNFAKKAFDMELKAGNAVIERKDECLVRMSWLVETVRKIGFEVEIAETCNCLRDGILLFYKP